MTDASALPPDASLGCSSPPEQAMQPPRAIAVAMQGLVRSRFTSVILPRSRNEVDYAVCANAPRTRANGVIDGAFESGQESVDEKPVVSTRIEPARGGGRVRCLQRFG